MSEIADKIYQDETICSYEEIKQAALDAKDCVQDIREKILDEVENDADLSDLNSTSSTAVWRIWIDIFAFLSFFMQQLWAKCKCELEEAARAAQPHPLAWYCQRAYEFQFGDPLQALDGSIYYDPIDESKRIITNCSVSENACNLLFKVKKEDNTPLTPSELQAFEGYHLMECLVRRVSLKQYVVLMEFVKLISLNWKQLLLTSIHLNISR